MLYRSYIYSANVRNFHEISKFCARRMQLNLFKTAEPQPKFNEVKKKHDYFSKKCRFRGFAVLHFCRLDICIFKF